ncbi:MAG: hypothetical protein CMH90_01430 [Oceanicaulis sp.]|uniref:hypothetical protein n=1 Tax=Oceanicaulis sp. UBA2681 TaxID=1947007 RepID=UPI000C0941AA|nr:hypothetical protein [Oceanicaulis sp. UBA2681]MAP48122.1 hypothetical protein [Oceanicaulis sp.]HCR67099.1 hypothetical protein [Oceanicaulis sp.]|tara:strand:+ start:2589 stop:3212 length:624 start_codon:yes stop_codon:yes gene_type:complete
MGFMITVAVFMPMILIAVIGVVVTAMIIMAVPVIVVVSGVVMMVGLRGRHVERFGEPAVHPDPVDTGMSGREAERSAPLGVRLYMQVVEVLKTFINDQHVNQALMTVHEVRGSHRRAIRTRKLQAQRRRTAWDEIAGRFHIETKPARVMLVFMGVSAMALIIVGVAMIIMLVSVIVVIMAMLLSDGRSREKRCAKSGEADERKTHGV